MKDLANEIVIVDGGSTDKTLDIAKDFGAKIIKTNNPPNFHINKNKAIDAAEKDWVLQLDADEIVTKELADEIKKVISANSFVEGFWIPRRNLFLGKFLTKGGQYPDYTLRLYKKGKGRLPQRDVHEQAEVEGEIGYLKESLLHYPYKSFDEYLIKWSRYTSLLATQIKDSLKNKSTISKCLYALGYIFIKPVHWFVISYIRHKGFMDLWPGFVFSLFSSLRFPVAYVKYLRRKT